MSYEKFKKELQEELDSRNIIEAKIVININNDTYPQLEVVNSHDIPLAQIPNLDLYYKMNKIFAVNIQDIANMIEMLILKSGFTSEIRLMTDWDIAKKRVLPQIMNTEKNFEYLKLVPHREILDMSVVYYIEIDSLNKDIKGKFVIPDFIFKDWNINEEELYRQAMDNMNRLKEPLLKDIFSVIKELSDGIDIENIKLECPDNHPEFYILTNKCRNNGAAYILDTSVLGAVSCILGDDLIICPSSTHEILIWRKNESLQPKELVEIVKEVNNSVVKDNEILSYSVYEFSNNQLKIAV